jgi:hypothetical protein
MKCLPLVRRHCYQVDFALQHVPRSWHMASHPQAPDLSTRLLVALPEPERRFSAAPYPPTPSSSSQPFFAWSVSASSSSPASPHLDSRDNTCTIFHRTLRAKNHGRAADRLRGNRGVPLARELASSARFELPLPRIFVGVPRRF